MAKLILVDFFFLPKANKFFSINAVACEMLALLCSMRRYEIDVLVHLGQPFEPVCGAKANQLVWERYYEEVFSDEVKQQLDLRKATFATSFNDQDVDQYDVIIQIVSSYQLRQYYNKPSIILHYDLIPVEYLYDQAITHVLDHYYANIQGNYMACISKPVLHSLHKLFPATSGFSSALPITYQRVIKSKASNFLPNKAYDLCMKYASDKLDRANFSTADDFEYILKIGSFDPTFDRKNHALTLLAWEKYCQMFPKQKVKLIMLGGACLGDDDVFIHNNPASIQPKALEHYLQRGDVLMLKDIAQEAVGSLIEQAACLTLPSKVEGFGMPVVEAMYFGCPVIVSDTDTLKWVAGDGALVCDPYDIDSLVRCFYALLAADDKESKREELIRKGYENIKRFAPEQVAPLWEICINEVSGKQRPANVV